MGTRFIFNTTAPTVVPTWARKAISLPISPHQDHAAANVEKSLGVVAATPATTLVISSLANTDPQSYFFGRFTSEPLAAQTFPAQTWNLYMSLGCGNSAAGTTHRPTLYFYRPSTNEIQYVFDGTTNPFGRVVYAGGGAIQTEGRVPVASSFTVQDGDVLVYEFWAWADQTMGTSYPQTAYINDAAAYIECVTTTVTFYTPPAGTNTPSVADTSTHGPMVPLDTTDVTVRSSAATALALSPMVAFAATSTVQRAPVLTNSVADSTSYALTAGANTTATVRRSYSSTALPTTYAITTATTPAKDIVQGFSTATALALSPMVPFDATATVLIGVVNVPSTALSTSYAIATAATPTKDVYQAFSVPTPASSFATSAAAATSIVARVYTSSANPTTYATTVPDTRDGIGCVAQPAAYSVVGYLIDVFFSGTTSLYPIANASNVTITGRKATAATLQTLTHTATSLGAVEPGPAVDGVLSSFWGGTGNINDRIVDLTANTSQQTQYYGRFISRPLAAQTIHAQTWNYALVVAAANLDANTYFWPVMYVYRPSNNTVVGHIFEPQVQAGAVWPATIAAAPTRNIAGLRVDAEEGDVLVIECYAVSQSSTGIARRQTWRMTANTSRIVSQYKILYKPTTILYFQNTTPAVTPTAGTKVSDTYLPKQPTSTQHTAASGSATEGTLSTALIQSPVGRTANSKANTSPQSLYFGRNSSAPLAAQTIPIQTWYWEVSCGTQNVNAHTFHWPVLYVWRPSTNSVVDFIFDGSGPLGVEWYVNIDPRLDQYFTGQKAVDVLDGDVLVCEVWGAGTQTAAGTYAEMVWTTAINASIVATVPIQFYTGAKQSISSPADPATYDLVESDAFGVYAPGIVDVPSIADPAVYAVSGGTGTGTLTHVVNALPGGFLLGLAAFPTRDTVAYYSNASQVAPSYAYSPTATTTSVGRVYSSTATSIGFAQTPFSTVDVMASFVVALPSAWASTYAPTTVSIYIAPIALSSVALAADYSSTPAPATVYLGRVYTSVAAPTSFALNPVETGQVFALNSGATLASYSSTGTVATTRADKTSVGLPTSYSATAAPSTVSLGRVYVSDATKATYALTPIGTGDAATSSSIAAFTTYSTTGVALVRTAWTTVGFPASYSTTGAPATVSLGRVVASDAAKASYALTPIDVWSNFALVSNASFNAYALTGAPATSGSLRATFSVAAYTTYSYTGLDTTDSLTLASSVIPSPASYSALAREAFGYAKRPSVALPIVFSGVAGTSTTTRFTRVGVAFPTEYTVYASPTNAAGGVRHISIAEPVAYLLSYAWSHEAHSRKVNAFPPTYSTTTPAATSVPMKNSIASAADYMMYMPDAWSGRVRFSTALPASYLATARAATSFASVKTSSVALPASFAVTGVATSIRRGYATHALPAAYLQEPWIVGDNATSQVKPPIVLPSYSPKPVITDAQFATWLEDERATRIVLIETRCIEPITGNTEYVYFASTGFVTKIEDGSSPTYYAPLMRGGLEFAQTIDLDLSGNQSYGDIELDNTEGDLDWMFDRVWLYKPMKAFVGDARWPRRDFRQIFDGTIEDVDSSQRDTVNVRLRDKFYRLDMPVHSTRIGGTTPNADRLTPFLIGECHNITPVLRDEKQLFYVYHTRTAEGVFEVRDNGIPVAYNFMSGAPMSFKLTKQPYGRITCSAQGDSVGGGFVGSGYVNTVATIIRRLMMEHGTEAANRFIARDIDNDNFVAFDIANKHPTGIFLTERTTVMDACQQIAASVGARLTMTALGKAQLIRLKLPPEPPPTNLLFNGDFSGGMDGWAFANGTGGIAPDPAYTGFNHPGWFPPNIPTFFTRQLGRSGVPDAYYEYKSNPILVEPGKRYTVSAYTGAHRCNTGVFFYEYDFSGNAIANSTLGYNNAEMVGGIDPDAYKFVTGTRVTKSTTHSIRVMIRKYDTSEGNTDSWFFINRIRVDGETINPAPIVVTESDIVSGSLHIADRLPLVAGALLGYCKNWTVQEDTASGVPEDHKAMYAREWLTVSQTDPVLRAQYGLSDEPEQENCLLLDKNSANVECNRRVQLRTTQRHVYEFIGFANLMFTPVGAAMTIKHRRFNLSAGKTGQVISVAVNWLNSQVTIKVLI